MSKRNIENGQVVSVIGDEGEFEAVVLNELDDDNYVVLADGVEIKIVFDPSDDSYYLIDD